MGYMQGSCLCFCSYHENVAYIVKVTLLADLFPKSMVLTNKRNWIEISCVTCFSEKRKASFEHQSIKYSSLNKIQKR